MYRLLFIAALLAVVAVVLTPASDVLCPHHDEAEVPHAAQDDDCGCICHVSVSAVAVTAVIEIHLLSTTAEHGDDHSLPEPVPSSIERPPELFS